MSTNTTDMGPPSHYIPTDTVHSQLNSLMISHTFLVLLVPLVIALFYFSTPQSRNRPIFYLNILTISMAFVDGVLVDVDAIHGILSPSDSWSLSLGSVINPLSIWLSITADFTLLLRLISVYPLNYVGPTRFSLVIGFPVLLKIIRVANAIKLLIHTNNPESGVVSLKIELFAQMIDNTYASLAFLWKLRHHGTVQVTTNSSKVTLAHRMHSVFLITAENFVVPAAFSVVQLCLVYSSVNILIFDQLAFVGIMIVTFGLVFATVWAGNISLQEAQILESRRNDTQNRIMRIFGMGSKRVQTDPLFTSGAGSMYSASSQEIKAA